MQQGIITGGVLKKKKKKTVRRPSHLVDESEVVGDEHEAALKVVDGLRQRVDGLNVQVVLKQGKGRGGGVQHVKWGRRWRTIFTTAEWWVRRDPFSSPLEAP